MEFKKEPHTKIVQYFQRCAAVSSNSTIAKRNKQGKKSVCLK